MEKESSLVDAWYFVRKMKSSLSSAKLNPMKLSN
jgi:hypothetical protein